jgi:hypothetical protein
MKLSPWVFALIISCSLSYGQYGKDFEDMSQSEKIMMYGQFKKSPALGLLYEVLIPTAGYAYAGKWERGIMVKALQWGGSFAIGAVSGSIFRQGGFKDKEEYFFLASLMIIKIYTCYDASEQINKYNHNLYRDIFGKEPPSFSLNLQPTYQGANLTLAYKFD